MTRARPEPLFANDVGYPRRSGVSHPRHHWMTPRPPRKPSRMASQSSKIDPSCPGPSRGPRANPREARVILAMPRRLRVIYLSPSVPRLEPCEPVRTMPSTSAPRPCRPFRRASASQEGTHRERSARSAGRGDGYRGGFDTGCVFGCCGHPMDTAPSRGRFEAQRQDRGRNQLHGEALHTLDVLIGAACGTPRVAVRVWRKRPGVQESGCTLAPTFPSSPGCPGRSLPSRTRSGLRARRAPPALRN